MYEQEIRKISIGLEYKNDSMHYFVGQEVYGGNKITDIIMEADGYEVWISDGNTTKIWKHFNKQMAISLEFKM